MELKIFTWNIGLGYRLIILTILAHTKEEAVQIIQSKQDEHVSNQKEIKEEIKDYKKKTGWKPNPFLPMPEEFHEMINKGCRMENFSDALKYMKEYEPTITKIDEPKLIMMEDYEE